MNQTATPPASPAVPDPHPAATSRPQTAPALRWYRTPIEREALRQVMSRSTTLAVMQTGGHLALLALTGGVTLWAAARGWWCAILPLLIVHGTVANFLINGVHELGHETVFTSRRLNRFLAYVFAFPCWVNHLHFAQSHGRHHRYTLHPPADLEVTLPTTLSWKDFRKFALVTPIWADWVLQGTWKAARGRLDGEWNRILFPDSEPELRRPVVRWARLLLAGHGAILLVAIWNHWWVLPLVVSFAPMFGGWLFWLCNNTQHIGLQDQVADARLCCRTIILNPVARFLYWHMNYHIEHHMFAAVPCYRLGRLHRLMRSDLPPCPVGLVATWRHIMEVMRQQTADPTYRYVAPVPMITVRNLVTE